MSDELTTVAYEGIKLCRQGSWSQGVTHLTRVAREKNADTKLPGVFYSYLGYGIALCEHRVREGLELCERAVKAGFYEPDNYLNLSRAHLLRKNRRTAVKWLGKGLKVDPNHDGLISLQNDLGFRKRPILPFLPRDSTFNILLGRMRHNLTKRR
jgi:hypothetical protein